MQRSLTLALLLIPLVASQASGAHAAEPIDAVPDWVIGVVSKLKALMLDADRRAAKAEADARIAQQQAALTGQRVGLLDALLTRCTSEWLLIRLDLNCLALPA